MTVAEHVRRDLERRRQAGQPFGEAWAQALGAAPALAALPRHEREAWLRVLHAHRRSWRAGYERRPLAPCAAAPGAVRELSEPEHRARAALTAR